jgi:lactate permease
MPFVPAIDPVANSLVISALVALLPLAVMFVTLGVLKWKVHWAGLTSLAVAIVISVVAYHMPVQLSLLSATQGAAFGLFPITYIVLAAIWMYQLTVVSGRFEDLRATFGLISDDPRVLAILIAFCFGGLLEALAGFGAPLAITGVMLMAIGYSALRAAVVVLIANTAPVAFGAVAIPIITAGQLTGIPYQEIGAVVGRQTSVLAAVVPLLLIFLADGKLGFKQVWPFAAVMGVSFGAAKWIASSYISVELTDVISSLFALAVGVVMLRFWKPKGGAEARARLKAEVDEHTAAGTHVVQPAPVVATGRLSGGRIAMAVFPYLLVVAVFAVAKLALASVLTIKGVTDLEFGWPGLFGQVAAAKPFKFDWLADPGTLLILCGVIIAIVYRVSVAAAWGELVKTVVKLRWTALTIATVLALASVMNLSGQTITIGTWIAGVGAIFAFLSPSLGYLGTAVTGSDTSANALFATLQQRVALELHIDPALLVAANTSGGTVGKVISPQNLAIAATAVGLVGQEALLLRKVIGWSLLLLVVFCLLVGLQSTPVLSWMLP